MADEVAGWASGDPAITCVDVVFSGHGHRLHDYVRMIFQCAKKLLLATQRDSAFCVGDIDVAAEHTHAFACGITDQVSPVYIQR